jgi:ribose transport system permease protein
LAVGARGAAAASPEERHPALVFLVTAWSWLFLLLLLDFELCARLDYGVSFLLNGYNLQSIAVFAAMPLLLGSRPERRHHRRRHRPLGRLRHGAGRRGHGQAHAGPDAGRPGADADLGLPAALAASLVAGLINGTLISHLRVPAFIGTLGMYGVARGGGFLIAGGTTVPVNNPFLFAMGNEHVLGVPMPVVITLAMVAAIHWVLSQTRFGQHTYAIGGNRVAAIRAGIDTRRHTLLFYLISAGCADVAGTVYTARFSAGAAQAGEPLLLDPIAAVVIGGASLFGGSSTIIGTVIGASIIAVSQYGLVFIDVEPFWQFVAVGIVIHRLGPDRPVARATHRRDPRWRVSRSSRCRS